MFRKKTKSPYNYSKRNNLERASNRKNLYPIRQPTMSEFQRNYYRKPPEDRRITYDDGYYFFQNRDGNGNSHSTYNENRDLFNMDVEMYNDDYDNYGYIVKDHQHRRERQNRRVHPVIETAYSEESDSECGVCNESRNRRELETEEYMSEYSYPTPQSYGLRQKNIPYRDRRGDDRIYRSPYRRNYNVYAVRDVTTGNQAFKNKQQKESEAYTTQGDSESLTEHELSDSSKNVTGKAEYQVYAAQVDPVKGGVFHQELGRERLLSVTDYNLISMPVVEDKKLTTSITDNSSDVVYLPVLVMDDTIDLPQSKIVKPETLIAKSRSKVKHPLEINMEVYAATDFGGGNIFRQAKMASDGVNMDHSIIENVQVYTVGLDKTSFKSKTPSLADRKELDNKASTNQSDFPVQKPYIKVAPFHKVSEKRGSETRLKPSATSLRSSRNTSSTRSLIGSPRPNSPHGSSYYSKIHLKHLKDRKRKKTRSKRIKDGFVSTDDVNQNPLPLESSNKTLVNEIKNGTIKGANNEGESIKEEGKDELIEIENSAEDKLNLMGENKISMENKSNLDNKNLSKNLSDDLQNKSNLDNKNLSKNFSDDLQKGDYNTKPLKRGLLKKFLSKTETKITSPEKKQSSYKIFSRKKNPQITRTRSRSNYSSEDQSIQMMQPTAMDMNNATNSIQSAMSKQITAMESTDKNIGIEDHQDYRLSLFKFDLTFLQILFQIGRFFLGLSTYSTLIEILRTFKIVDNT